MNSITLPSGSVSGQTEQEKLANLGLASEFKAAVTAHAYAPLIGEQDLAAVFQRVGELSTKSVKESSKDLEYMLTAQAIALDSIFNRLAVQAQASIGKHPKVVDTYLRLALKAQSQCRATAEALAVLKSPRQYISQTNVASTMQVNNSLEGLEARYGDRMDFGAQAASSSADSKLEALGEVHGSQNPGRQGCLQQERTEARGVFS